MFRRVLSVLIAVAIAFAVSGHVLVTAYAAADGGHAGHRATVQSIEDAGPAGGNTDHVAARTAANDPIKCCLDGNGQRGAVHSCGFSARVETPGEIETARSVDSTLYWQKLDRIDGHSPAALLRPPQQYS